MDNETKSYLDQKFAETIRHIDERFDESKRYTDERIEVLAGIVKGGFDAVEKRFDALDNRLIKIENQHGTRLDRLEDDVRVLKTTVGIR